MKTGISIKAFPELMEEWDWENNTLDPEKVTYGSKKDIHWVCKNNAEHKWIARPNNRTSNAKSGCPYCCPCGRMKKVSFETSIASSPLAEEWSSKNKQEPASVLLRSNTRVWWTCKTCQNDWQTTPTTRINKNSGCVYCNASANEKIIYDFLKNRNMEFVFEYKPKNLKSVHQLRFDFAIFSNNSIVGIIEFHGKQHYESSRNWDSYENLESRQKRDEIKSKYCKDNNIPLLVIDYRNDNVLSAVEDFLLGLKETPC